MARVRLKLPCLSIFYSAWDKQIVARNGRSSNHFSLIVKFRSYDDHSCSASLMRQQRVRHLCVTRVLNVLVIDRSLLLRGTASERDCSCQSSSQHYLHECRFHRPVLTNSKGHPAKPRRLRVATKRGRSWLDIHRTCGNGDKIGRLKSEKTGIAQLSCQSEIVDHDNGVLPIGLKLPFLGICNGAGYQYVLA